MGRTFRMPRDPQVDALVIEVVTPFRGGGVLSELICAAADDTAGRRRTHGRQLLLIESRAPLHAKHRGAVAVAVPH